MHIIIKSNVHWDCKLNTSNNFEYRLHRQPNEFKKVTVINHNRYSYKRFHGQNLVGWRRAWNDIYYSFLNETLSEYYNFKYFNKSHDNLIIQLPREMITIMTIRNISWVLTKNNRKYFKPNDFHGFMKIYVYIQDIIQLKITYEGILYTNVNT